MAIIAISGHTSAGKSVLADRLADFLGYSQFDMGKEVFRKMQAEQGYPSIESFCDALNMSPDIERAADLRQAERLANADDIIALGRITPFILRHKIAGFPVPAAKGINMLLNVGFEEGTKREAGRPQNTGKTLEEVREIRRTRLRVDMARYLKLYGIENYLDPRIFDVEIDTTLLTEEEVMNVALEMLTPKLLCRY